uniref:Uncharacterized protein n=1 Tax=Ixodes ricinus TaxID=34613 RepID=A0A6B0UUM5_IXORI
MALGNRLDLFFRGSTLWLLNVFRVIFSVGSSARWVGFLRFLLPRSDAGPPCRASGLSSRRLSRSCRNMTSWFRRGPCAPGIMGMPSFPSNLCVSFPALALLLRARCDGARIRCSCRCFWSGLGIVGDADAGRSACGPAELGVGSS